MTLHAIPFHGNLVRTDGFVWKDFLVAFKADHTWSRVQKLSVGSSMRIVTSGALASLHRGVNELTFQLFLEIGMAVQAKLSFGSGLQLELILPVASRNS